MRLPVAAEYAIRGIVHIAKSTRNGPVSLRQIATSELIPHNYLIKIFKGLAAAGLVRSHRGKKGGFSLTVDPAAVTLRRIVEAVQGPVCFNDCLLRPGCCGFDDWCPAHEIWQRVQRGICEILDSVTLAELAEKEAGRTRRDAADGPPTPTSP